MAILTKYTNFADVFLPDLVTEISKHIMINNHAINPIDGKNAFYELIYNPKLVELEIWKIYIKIDQVNDFIKHSKSPTSALIFFIPKSDGQPRLCIDYQDPNNLTIKNWYPLTLIRESMNLLDQAKHFTQLNLSNIFLYVCCLEDFWPWELINLLSCAEMIFVWEE